MSNQITVAELEDKVWSLEGVRIVIRSPQSELVEDYTYQRKISSKSSVTSWGENRLKPLLNGKDYYIVDGSGTRPHGRTNMGKVRDSYK